MDYHVNFPDFRYHRLDIRIAAKENTCFDGWPGAVIRNNLLFSTGQVKLPENGLTLYQYINTFPLDKKHILYKELSNGFPLPYYLYLHDLNDHSGKKFFIKKNEIITFSLILIGNISGYFKLFTESIRLMCSRGFGVDMKSFELLDIYEISGEGEKRIIAVTGEDLAKDLLFPVKISGFENYNISRKKDPVNITFQSPVCLIKTKKDKEKAPGVQEKTNAFPSFYQLVRTAAFRLAKLDILYTDPGNYEKPENLYAQIEEYVNDAAKLVLDSANIKLVSYQSTRKEGTTVRIPLRGYIGNISFRGNYEKYMPVLMYMQELGVGHEVVYGFGKYNIKQQTKIYDHEN